MIDHVYVVFCGRIGFGFSLDKIFLTEDSARRYTDDHNTKQDENEYYFSRIRIESECCL